MESEIIRNEINVSQNDEMILNFLKSFDCKKCLYCYQNNLKYLCLCKQCGYYFCNNTLKKNSHIIHHLKQCHHDIISIEPFESDLQCNKCKNKNIFNLLFTKQNKKLYFLCENCCVVDIDNYKKVASNKKIDNEILLSPNVPPLSNREDSYSESLINELNKKINLLLENRINSVVELNYYNKKKYFKIYFNLVNNEIQEIKNDNLSDDSYPFYLKFKKIDDYEFIVEITNDYKQKFQFFPRQLLYISKKNEDEEDEDQEEKIYFSGKVFKKEKNIIYMFCIDLKKNMDDGKYFIKEKQTTGSYERMLDGLDKFDSKKSYMLKDIESLIIGSNKEEFSNKNEYIKISDIPKEKELDIQDLINENIELNKNQKNTIINCFKNKFSLIKGPPGTGKSTVLTALTYHLNRLKKTNHKILICAPSNRAVDNISILLRKIKDLNFVRVLSPEKELCEDIDHTYSLYKLVKEKILKNPKNNERIINLMNRREKYGNLDRKTFEEYQKLLSNFENEIIESSDIVLSTISSSADPRLKDYYFPIVIIDEATQSLEPDCLLPLLHKAEMVILIGDDKQLGPVVLSNDAEISGFNISLFERLSFYYEGSNFIYILNEQYRSHEFLYRFSNEKFYHNQIITKSKHILNQNLMNEFPWPNKNIPSLFYHYTNPEEKEIKSYYNQTEINYIFNIVKILLKTGINPENIGIITTYNAQKHRLWERFYENKNYEKIKIESVDGFQGMEKEYIIISTVRSNENGFIGFLKSPKRLNVALTRAKKGLIILGNCKCLAKKNGIWRDLIIFYLSQHLIVEGALSNLDIVDKEEIISKEINVENYYDDDDDWKNEQKNEMKFCQGVKIKYNKKNKNDDFYNIKENNAAPPINNNLIINKNEENYNFHNNNNKNNNKNNNIFNNNNNNFNNNNNNNNNNINNINNNINNNIFKNFIKDINNNINNNKNEQNQFFKKKKKKKNKNIQKDDIKDNKKNNIKEEDIKEDKKEKNKKNKKNSKN